MSRVITFQKTNHMTVPLRLLTACALLGKAVATGIQSNGEQAARGAVMPVVGAGIGVRYGWRLLSLCLGLATLLAGTAGAAAQGTVVAWGDNLGGKSTVPPGLSGVVAVAAGTSHTVALKQDGTVVAWGDPAFGRTTVPPGLSGVTAIAAGQIHTVALKNDGTVLVLGGIGNPEVQTVPSGLSNVTAIAAGWVHTLALKADGTVVAWGFNTYGQTNVPTGLSGVKAIGAGFYHSLAVKSNGTVVAWGAGGPGQTGDPHYGQSIIPVGLNGVTSVTGGHRHSIAMKSDGSATAWGASDYGQTAVPIYFGNLNPLRAIAAGGIHNLALKSDGTVAAWGGNNSGQTTIPAGLSNVVAISAGFNHSVALISAIPLGPTFTSRPVSQTVLAGRNASFSVSAAGAPPLTYQWLFEGTNLAGATNGSYTVTGAGSNHAGRYTVVVSNAAGSVTSSPPAELKVLGPSSATASGLTVDPFFRPAPQPGLVKMLVQPDGKLLLAGWFGIKRLNADGSPDASFNPPKPTAYGAQVWDVQLGQDGKYILSGSGADENNVGIQGISKIFPDGTKDNTFVPTPDVYAIQAVGSLANGLVIAVGNSNLRDPDYQSSYNFLPILLGYSGTGASGIRHPTPNQVGSGIIGGLFDSAYRAIFGTANSVGSVPGGSTPGFPTGAGFHEPLLIQPFDDKVICVTYTDLNGIRLTRMNSDGSIDNTFTSPRFDTGFHPAFSITGLLQHTNGTILTTGYLTGDTGTLPPEGAPLYRLQSNGQLDTGFLPLNLLRDGILNTNYTNPRLTCKDFAVQADNRILALTYLSGGSGSSGTSVVRLNEDGSRDLAFRSPDPYFDKVPNANFGVASGRPALALAPDGTVYVYDKGSDLTSGGVIRRLRPDFAPIMDQAPQSQVVNSGDFVDLRASAFGTGPVTYQWLSNGIPFQVPPGEVGAGTENRNNLYFRMGSQPAMYSLAVINPLGRATSAVAYVVNPGPPTLFQQPQNVLTTNGNTVQFSIAAFGAGQVSYQWQRSGTNLTGATNATLSLTNVSVAQAGAYSVSVGNASGTTNSTVATLTVLVPPQISVPPPASVTNGLGTTAQFGVTATGTAPLAYQWFNGTTPVLNATSATLSLPNVQLAQAGNYFVVITNAAGAVTSSVVSLTVTVLPPSLLTQPMGQSFTLGSGLTLSVTAGGTGPLFYQWQFNGTNLPGATSASLALANLAATNAGRYRVVVTNAVGTATSAEAVLRFFGDLQMYAGMLLSGEPGDRYRVEYAEVLGAVTNWVPVVTNFYHPGGVTVFFDTNSPGRPRRFYRSLFLTNDPVVGLH